MNRSSQKNGPSFLLRGFDPQEVLNKYQSGYYANSSVERKNITIATVSNIFDEKLSNDPNSLIYYIRARQSKISCVRTNFEDYNSMTNGSPCQFRGPCQHCGKDSTMGYPVEYREHPVLVNGTYQIRYYFWVEGRVCSFRCAESVIRKNISTLPSCCLNLLHFLYRLLYPNGPELKEALDILLHERYGGPLNDEKWESGPQYYPSTRVFLFPASTEYRTI